MLTLASFKMRERKSSSHLIFLAPTHSLSHTLPLSPFVLLQSWFIPVYYNESSMISSLFLSSIIGMNSRFLGLVRFGRRRMFATIQHFGLFGWLGTTTALGWLRTLSWFASTGTASSTLCWGMTRRGRFITIRLASFAWRGHTSIPIIAHGMFDAMIPSLTGLTSIPIIVHGMWVEISDGRLWWFRSGIERSWTNGGWSFFESGAECWIGSGVISSLEQGW